MSAELPSEIYCSLIDWIISTHKREYSYNHNHFRYVLCVADITRLRAVNLQFFNIIQHNHNLWKSIYMRFYPYSKLSRRNWQNFVLSDAAKKCDKAHHDGQNKYIRDVRNCFRDWMALSKQWPPPTNRIKNMRRNFVMQPIPKWIKSRYYVNLLSYWKKKLLKIEAKDKMAPPVVFVSPSLPIVPTTTPQ
jgi:hypothetical protein